MFSYYKDMEILHMKITYGTHYKSLREDGRHVSTMAAYMDMLRNSEAALALPEELSQDSLAE